MAELPFRLPVPVALAQATDSLEVLPPGRAQYSPKYDGFRALYGAGRLYSRNGTELTRYFPDLVPVLRARMGADLVVDGELICWSTSTRRLDFAALSRRLTAGRGLAQLVSRHPAHLVCFDVLAADGADVRSRPLRERARILEHALLGLSSPIELCQTTTDIDVARDWMSTLAVAGVEGVMIKDLDSLYPRQSARPWFKAKTRHSLDLVVTGVTGDPKAPTSLVLALPTAEGLHTVGATTVLSRATAHAIGKLVCLNSERSRHFGSLPGTQDPVDTAGVEPFVVEVYADVAIDGGKLRHGARFLRARPDLTPEDLVLPASERS